MTPVKLSGFGGKTDENL